MKFVCRSLLPLGAPAAPLGFRVVPWSKVNKNLKQHFLNHIKSQKGLLKNYFCLDSNLVTEQPWNLWSLSSLIIELCPKLNSKWKLLLNLKLVILIYGIKFVKNVQFYGSQRLKNPQGCLKYFFSRKLMISIHYFYIFSLMCCGSELAVLLPES